MKEFLTHLLGTGEPMDSKKIFDFQLERYKYVLSQKQKLDETTWKVVSMYQSAVFVLGSGIFAVAAASDKAALSRELSFIGLSALYCLFLILSAFSIILLVSGMLSWLAYRRDEDEIMLIAGGTPKSPVRIVDIFRWYETYVILLMLGIAAFGTWATWAWVGPML
jgi:hypothetical protein